MTTEQAEGSADEEPIRQRVERLADTVALPVGLVSGIVTAFVGYLVFFGVVVATGAVDFSRSIGDILRPVGNFYYNAHNVPTYERQLIEIEQGEATGELLREFWVNRITGWQRVHQELRSSETVLEEATQTSVITTDTSLPQEVYLLIPVVVLLAAGVIVAIRSVELPAEGMDTGLTSLLVGGAITLGYLLVVLLGTYVLATGGSDGATALHPARFEALGYGIAYPLVFVTLGALGGLQWQHRST